MGLKSYKPVTASMRFTDGFTFDEITKSRPDRALTEPYAKNGGRNSAGRITVRHQGGGHKRLYRMIDFRRDKHGIPAKVAAIEYDPNRSARIALLHYKDGEKRYIVCPVGLKVGATVVSGPAAEAEIGNMLPLANIPVGLEIHCIELERGRGGQIARSAGQTATLMSRENGFAQIRLPSGEIRKIRVECMATVGQVGNLEWSSRSLGKAGRKRWLGVRPTVRGVAMNPVDHPMGGGEGRTSGGGHPVTPWGQLTKGKKTRSRRKPSQRRIVERRK